MKMISLKYYLIIALVSFVFLCCGQNKKDKENRSEKSDSVFIDLNLVLEKLHNKGNANDILELSRKVFNSDTLFVFHTDSAYLIDFNRNVTYVSTMESKYLPNLLIVGNMEKSGDSISEIKILNPSAIIANTLKGGSGWHLFFRHSKTVEYQLDKSVYFEM